MLYNAKYETFNQLTEDLTKRNTAAVRKIYAADHQVAAKVETIAQRLIDNGYVVIGDTATEETTSTTTDVPSEESTSEPVANIESSANDAENPVAVSDVPEMDTEHAKRINSAGLALKDAIKSDIEALGKTIDLVKNAIPVKEVWETTIANLIKVGGVSEDAYKLDFNAKEVTFDVGLEFVNRVKAGKLKVGKDEITLESLSKAALVATKPSDKLQKDIDAYLSDNAEKLQVLATTVKDVHAELTAIFNAYGADLKYTISPQNGVLTIVNTLLKGQKRENSGTRSTGTNTVKGYIVIRGIERKGIENGYQYRLISDTNDWKVVTSRVDENNQPVGPETVVGNGSLLCKAGETPVAYIAKAIAERSSTGKAQRSVYDLFNNSEAIFYGRTPSGAKTIAPELPEDLAKLVK